MYTIYNVRGKKKRHLDKTLICCYRYKLPFLWQLLKLSYYFGEALPNNVANIHSFCHLIYIPYWELSEFIRLGVIKWK